MKIVVSPAKSLDFETKMPTTRGTQPTFLEQAAQINRLKLMTRKMHSQQCMLLQEMFTQV